MHIYMRIYTQIHTYIHTDTYIYVHIYRYTDIQIYTYTHIHIYTYTHIGDEALECIIPEGARSDEDALHLNDMAGLLYMTAIVVFFAWLVNCWERWSLLPL